METAAPYRIHCFGAPHAVLVGDATRTKIPLKRSLGWCLLARLQNDALLTRAKLCDELEVEDGNLGQAIKECRDTFGKECIPKTSGSVSLKAGYFESDIAEFDALKLCADALMYTQRMALYTEAFALVTGEFLAGCVNVNLRWLEKRNAATFAVGNALIDHWTQEKHPRQALEIAEQLAAALPRDTQITDKVLRLRLECGMEAAPASASSLAEWTHFVRAVAKKQHRLTTAETDAYHQALQCRFNALVAPLRTALCKLSVLQDSFDANMADGVCGVYETELSLLSATCFLTQCDGRFEMPPLIREWVFARNLPSQQDVLRTAYHKTVILSYQSGRLGDWYIQPNFTAYWTLNAHHLDAVICHLVTTSALPPDVPEEFSIFLCAHGTQSFLPHRAPEIYALFARLLAAIQTPTLLCFHLHAYSGELAYFLHDHKAAVFHHNWCIENGRIVMPDEDRVWHSTLRHLLNLHHSGDVSEAIALAKKWMPVLREHPNKQALCELLNRYADSLLAFGRFEEAYDACTEALELAAAQSPPRPPAPLLYHQGMALAGLKRREEAVASFDEALALFEKMEDIHGQADCLQHLGKLHTQQGQVNTGKRLVEDALRLYRSIGKEHSRAACLRSLGDVLKLKGDFDGAKSAYCEGLDFWENEVAEGRGGSGWVRRFRERLNELQHPQTAGV